MNMNLTHWILCAAGMFAGGSLVAYLSKKNKSLPFPDYQKKCEERAQNEFVSSDEIKKTILVLEKINDDEIAAFFYRSYADGKIKKQEVSGTRYKLCDCPEDIVASINQENCIIKKY